MSDTNVDADRAAGGTTPAVKHAHDDGSDVDELVGTTVAAAIAASPKKRVKSCDDDDDDNNKDHGGEADGDAKEEEEDADADDNDDSAKEENGVDEKDDNNTEGAENGEEDDDEDDKGDDEDDKGDDDKLLTVEGRRPTKQVDKFMPAEIKEKRPLMIHNGRGKLLGDITEINAALTKLKGSDPLLKILHKLIYGTPGVHNLIKAHLRQFNGWDMEMTTEEHDKKIVQLTQHPIKILKEICTLLHIKRTGDHQTLVHSINEFLEKPHGGQASSTRKPTTPKKATPSKSKTTTPSKSPAGKKASPARAKSSSSNSSAKGRKEADDDDDAGYVSVPSSAPSSEKEAAQDSHRKSTGSHTKDEEEDDVPLATLKHKVPSDEELTAKINEIIGTADLSTTTVKTIISMLVSHFGVDLTPKISFIRSTVKAALK